MAELPANPPRPLLVLPGQGESHAIGPSLITHKLDGAATGGRFALIEYAVAPRFVAPSDEPAKILFIYTPAGFEEYFCAVAAVIAKNPGVAVKDLGDELGPLWQHYGIESEG